MDPFVYSKQFRKLVADLLRGWEDEPSYHHRLQAHLGGPNSRVLKFANYLCPEIEYHCGSLKHKRVLDFGCGTGSTTVALAQYSQTVCAFDINRERIEICRRRLSEHSLEDKVQLYCADDLDRVKNSLGSFDLILVNAVIEHIPLTKKGLRKKTILCLFDLLKKPGYLYINETPNRLFPYDSHTTGLWWIPWTKPGSEWAYRRALKKGRHFHNPAVSEGPLVLEESGAWGVTYWEIKSYLKDRKFTCLNLTRNHDRHLHYFRPRVTLMNNWKRIVYTTFELSMYLFAVKLLHVPLTAFFSGIANLVIKKC